MVDVGALSFEDVVQVARHGAPVQLSDAAKDAITAARDVIDDLAASESAHYGISTGFGALATRHIPGDMRAQFAEFFAIAAPKLVPAGGIVAEPLAQGRTRCNFLEP